MRISDWSSDVCSSDLVDAEGVVVDHHELFGLLEAAGLHLEGREAADADGAIVGPLHVMGGDRRAVVELGILADLEGDRLAVGRHGIRSEERRVGKECVSTCRSWWSAEYEKKK